MTRITDFTDLKAWQKGHQLVVVLYRVTRTFPKDELFGLTSQMRRAGISVTSNIAEGFGRHGYKEKAQFYAIARGSTIEIKNQLMIARDVELLKQETFNILFELASDVHRLLNGLLKATRERSLTSNI